MGIQRFHEFPANSGSLTNDDILLFMDNPGNSGITKKISITELSTAIGSGGSSVNNPADNRILTSNASGTIDAEQYFVFNNVAKTTNITSPTTDGDTGPWYILSSYGDSGTLAKGGRFVGRRYRGTEESPLPASSGDTLAVFRGDSPNASGNLTTSSRILMKAEDTAQSGYTSVPSRIEISTSSGPSTSDNNLILYPNGQLYHDGYMTIDDGLSSPTPILSLGTISGNTAINYAVDRQIQQLTLNGTSVNFTKGTGWALANRSVDVILEITVSSTTTVAFDVNFVTDWYATLPTFSAGKYLILLRSIGSSTVQGHYIGKKV